MCAKCHHSRTIITRDINWNIWLLFGTQCMYSRDNYYNIRSKCNDHGLLWKSGRLFPRSNWKPCFSIENSQSTWDEVCTCRWNPVKDLLASSSADGTALIWNSNDGNTQSESNRLLIHNCDIRPPRRGVTCLDWNGAGSLLAIGSLDGYTRIWSAEGRLVSELNPPSRKPILAVKWNKNVIISYSQGVAITLKLGNLMLFAWKRSVLVSDRNEKVCLHPQLLYCRLRPLDCIIPEDFQTRNPSCSLDSNTGESKQGTNLLHVLTIRLSRYYISKQLTQWLDKHCEMEPFAALPGVKLIIQVWI